jgi:hypothetical protein
MLSEAERLVNILKKTELFDEVNLISDSNKSSDIILEIIHRPPGLEDPDNVWALLYLRVIPVYQGEQRGIYFKFLKGGAGEFHFDWVEEIILSIYSWAISGLSKEWQSTTEDSKYWEELRKKLVMDIYDKVPNSREHEY